MDQYLMHAGVKGWAKKAHKYISRTWKNGKWFYTYKSTGNGGSLKKYNKIQDWLGVDERDAKNNAAKSLERQKKVLEGDK